MLITTLRVMVQVIFIEEVKWNRTFNVKTHFESGDRSLFFP